MKRLVVASRNPVKARAVELGFRKMYPDQACEVRTVSVASDVADQPMTDVETLRGATNRAVAARSAAPGADFWIGIEGGIEDSDQGMAAFAWVVVMSSEGQGQGKTATFFLPEEIADLVRGGMELGHADDVVFGHENSKQKDGAIGLLTDNAVDRAALYEQGVIMAFVPFKNDRHYRQAREQTWDPAE